MIVGLRGRLARWEPASSVAWVDVGGVSYEVLMPAFACEWMATHRVGEEVQLYTYYHVAERNPSPVLIGFQHPAEREFFRKFIEVPDVGPAKAVRALTHPVSEIARWIEGQDTKSLQQLPGIGSRLSQTIVAQLHGRLLEQALLRDDVEPLAPGEAADLREDAVEALVSLQYPRRDAEQLVLGALRSRPDVGSLEDLLRAILEQQAPAG